MNDFMVGVLGNVLVTIVFLGVAWWKTDAIAARLEEKRRLQDWKALGASADREIRATLLFFSVNVAHLQGWSAPPTPKGFGAVYASAWIETIGGFLARVAPYEADLPTHYKFSGEFETLVIGSIPRIREVVTRSFKRFDRVAERYSHALPTMLWIALLDAIAAHEHYLDQVQIVDGETPEDSAARTFITNARVALRLFRSIDKLSGELALWPVAATIAPAGVIVNNPLK